MFDRALGAMCGWRGGSGARTGDGVAASPVNSGTVPAPAPCGIGAAARAGPPAARMASATTMIACRLRIAPESCRLPAPGAQGRRAAVQKPEPSLARARGLCSAAPMPFDQYHEPPSELPAATRTFARLCASLIEEAEAIGWYEQRLAVERDPEARAIMRDAQGEEFKHFSMDLEYLLRRTPEWREVAEGILLQEGDIVAHGEEAEEEATEEEAARGAPLVGSESLGIGGLHRVAS